MTPSDSERVRALISSFADGEGVSVEEGTRDGELVVTLEGEDKLRTTCSFLVRERGVSVSAFVIRRPDENEVGVYRFLLRRNLALPLLAYAIDKTGDVFLTGVVPLGAFDEALLDQLLGVILESTDGVFNELLVLGFLGSMRREWVWRTSREESLANLEPFRHLLEDGADEPDLSGEHRDIAPGAHLVQDAVEHAANDDSSPVAPTPPGRAPARPASELLEGGLTDGDASR